jgi:glucose/arabinose dehydrogenase
VHAAAVFGGDARPGGSVIAVTSAPASLSSRRLLTVVLSAAALLVAPTPVAAAVPLTLVDDGYTLPVFVTHAGDSRLFVVEKGGVIKIVSGGTFLDISAKISTSGERGLLSLAFDPNYAGNRLFYVNYTRASDGDIVIAEYKRSLADPDLADPLSERILLTIEHSSASNHNGGTLMFKNGHLFITTGDGGSDPTNAQNLSSLLGKILRIDPHDPDGNGPLRYSIPSGNPYVGEPGNDEIWSRGLRNPWRCSFDRLTGYLWCGDVGQDAWEEVDRYLAGKGRNFGWPLLEGSHYYNYPNKQRGNPCTSNCRTRPITEYPHAVAGTDNSNVTGGYVSRRQGAALYGKYLFADFGSGRIWSIPAGSGRGTPMPAPLAETSYVISSFGEDKDGRLYLVDYGGGAVYQLDDS